MYRKAFHIQCILNSSFFISNETGTLNVAKMVRFSWATLYDVHVHMLTVVFVTCRKLCRPLTISKVLGSIVVDKIIKHLENYESKKINRCFVKRQFFIIKLFNGFQRRNQSQRTSLSEPPPPNTFVRPTSRRGSRVE